MSNNQETQNFLNGGFNAAQYDIFGDITGLIAGVALVQITKSVIKAMGTGNGGKLELTVEGLEGENAGRKAIWNLSIYHNDASTAELARRGLSTLMAAIGMEGQTIQSTTQLHNRPFSVLVEPSKDPERAAKGYTDIRRVVLDGSDGASVPGQAAPMTQQAAPAAGGGWGAPVQAQAPQQQAQVQQQAPVQQQAAPAQQQAPAQWGAPAGGNAPTWGQ